MSPIDDELRTALQRRATGVAPAPDPLAGIERRAGRMRRTRLATSVAGSVLAVAAVATAVPLLTGPTAPDAPPVAVTRPTATPTPAVTTSSYALDPLGAWPYRGTPLDELGDGFVDTVTRELGTRHGGAGARLAPLWGQVDEPSGLPELVFVATVEDEHRWGVARVSESGPEFLVDEPLPRPALALAAALPGDEVARLVVVAAPAVGALQYGHDDASEWVPMAERAPGVGITALDGDPATASYRVLDAAGGELVRAPVPAVAAPTGQEQEPEPEQPPTDETPVVDRAAYAFDADDPWDFRGDSDVAGLAVEDERLFVATDPARDDGSWSQRPLYAGTSDAGVSFLVLLHTAEGEQPVVTTTWQVGDRAAEQTEQQVEPGQLLVQSVVPTDLDDGSLLLVALASPRAGGIVLEQPSGARPDGIGDPGVGLWLLPPDDREGRVLLYSEGDGLEYHAEPVAPGPGG